MVRRKIDYLRLSVTDKCNLNCLYCTPMEKDRFLSPNEILQNEETVRLVAAFVKLGIRSVRLTGGEPLIRQDIIDLVGTLRSINGLQDLAITTNGVYLKNLAYHLKQAGLDRINISLDTLKKDRFKHITGADCFDEVLAGIEKSLEAGFYPVKLNVILMKGINEDEVIDFARLAVNRNLIVRFIELEYADVECILKNDGILIKSTVRATAKTGVEMEAMVACSMAALTIYDMCKMFSKSIEITDLCLIEKKGGKSGTYKRGDQ